MQITAQNVTAINTMFFSSAGEGILGFPLGLSLCPFNRGLLASKFFQHALLAVWHVASDNVFGKSFPLRPRAAPINDEAAKFCDAVYGIHLVSLLKGCLRAMCFSSYSTSFSCLIMRGLFQEYDLQAGQHFGTSSVRGVHV
jgi:hypothetical protein